MFDCGGGGRYCYSGDSGIVRLFCEGFGLVIGGLFRYYRGF